MPKKREVQARIIRLSRKKVDKNASQNWLKSQLSFSKVVNTIMVLGVFGFIPGAWILGISLLSIYGILKQKSIGRALNQLKSGLGTMWDELAQNSIKRISDLYSKKPASVIKTALVCALLFFSGINSFSLIALYGLFSHTTEEWIELFKEKSERSIRFLNEIYNGLKRNKTYNKSLMRGGIVAISLLSLIAIVGLISLPASLVELVCTWIGFNAIMNDLISALKRPIGSLLGNSGKILGGVWGNWIAYALFKGKIHGNLGYPVGYLENPGFASHLLSTLFNPKGGFSSGSGIFNTILFHVRAFVNSLFSSVFVSHEVHMHGDFYGSLGPSPIQVFACIALGAFVGYLIERGVDNISKAMANDASSVVQESIKSAQKKGKKIFHQQNTPENKQKMKYHTLFVAVATPIILSSPSGATLVALAGGSYFAAFILTCGLMTTAFLAINGLVKLATGTNQPGAKKAPIKGIKNAKSNDKSKKGKPIELNKAKRYTPASDMNRKKLTTRDIRELSQLGMRVKARRK